MPTAVAELLATLARHAPRLPGAACRANPAVMDLDGKGGANPAAMTRAQQVCHSCPAPARRGLTA